MVSGDYANFSNHDMNVCIFSYYDGGGGKMARVAYRTSDVDLMARMMRAEAEGEGIKECFM